MTACLQRRHAAALPLLRDVSARAGARARLLKPLRCSSCYGARLLLCSLEGRFLLLSPAEIPSAQPGNSGLGIRETGPLISFNSSCYVPFFFFFPNLPFQFTASFWPLCWYCTSVNFDFASRFDHSPKSFSRSPGFNLICALDLPHGYVIGTIRMWSN